MSKKLTIILVLTLCIGSLVLFLSQREPAKALQEPVEKVSESPEETRIIATMLESRTYGRVFLQNQDQDSEYLYVLAEPNDVVSDGGLRYSPTTHDMNMGNVYEIHGIISDPCFDRHEVVEGEGKVCITWMDLDKSTLIEQ
jgi:hypothetical protein